MDISEKTSESSAVTMDEATSATSNKGRDTFVMRRTWFEGAKDMLDDNEADNANALLFAICNYGFDKVEPNFKGTMLALWRTIKRQMDETETRYSNSVKNGQKGAEYGSKGGRPKKTKTPNETPKKTPNETPKKTPNETPNGTGEKPLYDDEDEYDNEDVNEDKDDNAATGGYRPLSFPVEFIDNIMNGFGLSEHQVRKGIEQFRGGKNGVSWKDDKDFRNNVFNWFTNNEQRIRRTIPEMPSNPIESLSAKEIYELANGR